MALKQLYKNREIKKQKRFSDKKTVSFTVLLRLLRVLYTFRQRFGSGSELDPYSRAV